MSYKVEVIADSTGKWIGNGVRYTSEGEATNAAMDLAGRWYAVRDWRVVKSEDGVTEVVA